MKITDIEIRMCRHKNTGMKDSEMVEQWTKTLHTVEYAMEQLKHQKTALMKKREDIVTSKETKNG